MNIIFLSGGYYPNSSATGNCVRQIAGMFKERGYNIYVICKSPNSEQGTGIYNSQKLLWITNKRLTKGDELTSNLDSVGKRISLFFHKAYWAFYMLLRRDGMDDQLVCSYYERLNDLSKEINIDAIIPCCMPVETLKASYLFCKENHVPLFLLLYDPYSENKDYFRFNWNHRIRKKEAERIEERIFKSATSIFYVDNWKQYFSQHVFPNAIRVEHPLVVNRKVDPKPLNKATVINAIYQGEINKQMRPPEAMLNVFEYLVDVDKQISLHIFASGNAIDEVQSSQSQYPENIMFYGRVNKEDADHFYDAANIAIILANKNKEIVPSKIFECIASGYPIVYLYYSIEENSYKLLKKYPLVYFVNQNEKNTRVYEKLRHWMYENKDKRIPFNYIKEKYSDATPDFVVDSTLNSIGDKGNE